MTAAVEDAYANGALGANVFGTGKRIDIVLHRGAGAYICGEETALMNSLEGKRGNPRIKPPFPAVAGVFGMPNTPATAGNGGLIRGLPRLPSSEFISAVSSPQMYAPAPRWSTMSIRLPEPKAFAAEGAAGVGLRHAPPA